MRVKISKLIKTLQKIQSEEGDLDVLIYKNSNYWSEPLEQCSVQELRKRPEFDIWVDDKHRFIDSYQEKGIWDNF